MCEKGGGGERDGRTFARTIPQIAYGVNLPWVYRLQQRNIRRVMLTGVHDIIVCIKEREYMSQDCQSQRKNEATQRTQGRECAEVQPAHLSWHDWASWQWHDWVYRE